jgi:hypothetical protein
LAAHAALMNPTSKGALWATSAAPRTNSRKLGSTSANGGAATTMASVIPVSTEMNGGIGDPGSTSVPNSPSTSPPRTFTAPISVIACCAAEPPVVSRSKTTNVTSRSGVPSSSRVPCTGATPTTLERPTDNYAAAASHSRRSIA